MLLYYIQNDFESQLRGLSWCKKEDTVNYREMTDDEIKTAVKKIINKETAEETVRQRIKEELGYEGTPSICSCSARSGPMVMTMFSVMIFGSSGNVILIS